MRADRATPSPHAYEFRFRAIFRRAEELAYDASAIPLDACADDVAPRGWLL